MTFSIRCTLSVIISVAAQCSCFHISYSCSLSHPFLMNFFFSLFFFRTSNEIEQRNDNLEMSAKVDDICYSSFSPEDIVATDIYSNRTYHRRYLRVASGRKIRYVLLSFSAINLLLDIRKKLPFKCFVIHHNFLIMC